MAVQTGGKAGYAIAVYLFWLCPTVLGGCAYGLLAGPTKAIPKLC